VADLTSTIGSLAAIWSPPTEEEKRKKNQRHGRPWMDDPETFVNRTECAQPGCDFVAEGPVGATSLAFKAHLAEAHPEIEPARPRSRRRR
jgi:hypothetical protein